MLSAPAAAPQGRAKRGRGSQAEQPQDAEIERNAQRLQAVREHDAAVARREAEREAAVAAVNGRATRPRKRVD